MNAVDRLEALTVAMALAPGVYARNRMFDFFRKAIVRRAKTRAASLRGIVPQLPRATSLSLTCDGTPRTPSGEPVFVLKYRIPAMRLARVIELTPTELAALRILAERAGVTCLPPDEADRMRVDAALARLLEGAESTHDLARAAMTRSSPPER